jgi:hypothetical protein
MAGMARQEDSPVMLSAAKHLSAHPDRPVAAAQGDKKGPSIGINLSHEDRQNAG